MWHSTFIYLLGPMYLLHFVMVFNFIFFRFLKAIAESSNIRCFLKNEYDCVSINFFLQLECVTKTYLQLTAFVHSVGNHARTRCLKIHRRKYLICVLFYHHSSSSSLFLSIAPSSFKPFLSPLAIFLSSFSRHFSIFSRYFPVFFF